MQNTNQDNVSYIGNKGINLSVELPKSFSYEDAEKIKFDLLDFIGKKNNYGANHDKKEIIKIKTILWTTNDA